MAKFVAIRPHNTGLFPADHVDVEGTTQEVVLAQAQADIPGGRYLSRILTPEGTTLWCESCGWTQAGRAALPN
jgi:hypothetical protein